MSVVCFIETYSDRAIEAEGHLHFPTLPMACSFQTSSQEWESLGDTLYRTYDNLPDVAPGVVDRSSISLSIFLTE